MDLDLTSKPSSNVPLPDSLIAERKMAEQQPEPKQLGWWNLRDIAGSLSGVTRAVDESDMPAHWKAAIKADIAEKCGTEFKFVYIDAHYMVEKGNAVLHYHIKPDNKLI